VTYES
jgi:hypothetical protein